MPLQMTHIMIRSVDIHSIEEHYLARLKAQLLLDALPADLAWVRMPPPSVGFQPLRHHHLGPLPPADYTMVIIPLMKVPVSHHCYT
jgi:hypothetical protein